MLTRRLHWDSGLLHQSLMCNSLIQPAHPLLYMQHFCSSTRQRLCMYTLSCRIPPYVYYHTNTTHIISSTVQLRSNMAWSWILYVL